MIFVKIEGTDQYLAADYSKDIEGKLVKLYGIPEQDINFIISGSLFTHKGQEQTSFQVVCEIVAPEKFEVKEKEVEKYLAESLQNIAIHSHILFTYFKENHYYDETNPEYPLYMTEENMVKAETEDEYNEEKESEDDNGSDLDDGIYMGNVFQELDDFVASHPEMSKDEATLLYYKNKAKN